METVSVKKKTPNIQIIFSSPLSLLPVLEMGEKIDNT